MAQTMKEQLFGPYGSTSVRTAEHVRESGGNAIWFHGFDPVGFDAANRWELRPCVEFRTFRDDFNEHPNLIPIGKDGKPIRYGKLVQGVCLSQTAFIEEREQELINGMKRFSPYGVWLDYLTYSGWFETPNPDLQESCFCPACMRLFCETEGVDAERPEEILDHHRQAWTAHKCARTNHHGRRFAEIIKKTVPDCLIGIYLCPWSPDEFDGALRSIFAQDLRLFDQWADVFTPLIYAEKSGRGSDWSRQYLESSQTFVPIGTPILPILDMLDFPQTVEALTNCSERIWGFQLFDGARAFDNPSSRASIASMIRNLQS